MADDPPYLTVGTEVSAKYKGAFCEAKIRKVVRVVKCKVTFKAGNGGALLTDDHIKGFLRIGAVVEARHPDKGQFIEATINKIQDCSQYTVVFDDGDITTLRRSALCLKSGRHFNESETLDQLPLTHPEHFSNPVVGGRRGVRRRAADKDESSDEEEEETTPTKKDVRKKYEKELDMGKVVCVESTDKKKSKDTWFPALVVSPAAQETVKIRIKDEYLVRSFRDGRYYTVPKKEITEFTKESINKYDSNSNVLRSAVDKALQYLEKNDLPPHWDREVLFGNARHSESGDGDDQQSESEVEDDPKNEEKDRFIAQLYKFMDDRSTPLNKVPQVCSKDLDLHKLFKTVTGKGGYTKVTNQSQWKSVTIKMGYGTMPTTSTINLVKQAYKKFLFNFEEFYRKLGCTWTPRSSITNTSKSRSSRSIFRERGTPSSSSRESAREKKGGDDDESSGRATPSSSTKGKEKDKDKDKAEKSTEEKVKPALSSPEARASSVESLAPEDTKPPEPVEVKPKADPPDEIRKSARGRQPKKDRDEESASPSTSSRKKRQATASRDRDRDSSVASSTKDEGSAPPTPVKEKDKEKEAPTPTTPTTGKKGLGVGRGKYKRQSGKGPEPEEKEPPKEKEKEKEKEKPKPVEPPPPPPVVVKSTLEIRLGDKLLVYYPKQQGKVYEAKVIDMTDNGDKFYVHYTGWNNRYDEWIDRDRVSQNRTLKQEMEQDERSKAQASGASPSGKQDGKGPGAKQRKGRNSSSATSTTSASSGSQPPAPQPSTPSTTRSGKAALAAAASLSPSPVSGKRRRSTSSEVMPAIPAPKRRRTRQKSGQDSAAGHGSESEPETSDSDGRSIKSEKTDAIERRRTPISRKESITPTPEVKMGKRGSKEALNEDSKPSKADKKGTSSAMEVDEDDAVSSTSATSTKSKDTKPPQATAVVDTKESSNSSNSNSTSGSGQVLDLDQIRSEMKGLDKMMKGAPGAASSPAPPTLAAVGSSPQEGSKVDIYEFQEDGADDTAPAPNAPKLKMFSPAAARSSATPDKSEKGPITVSATSAEVVAKFGSAQESDKVPFVAIEKMDKEKDKPSKATPSADSDQEPSAKTTPPTKSSKDKNSAVPVIIHSTAFTNMGPSSVISGGANPPLVSHSNVIFSTGIVPPMAPIKGKSSTPFPVASYVIPPPRVVPAIQAGQQHSIISTPPTHVQPLITGASAPIVAATISSVVPPQSLLTSSVASTPPPVLPQQQQRPVISLSPVSGGLQAPLSTPLAPVTGGKGDSILICQSIPRFGRKEELSPQIIHHSSADPSASLNIPTISIVAKPSTAEISGSESVPPPSQHLKIAATIPPPPPVVAKTPTKGFGQGSTVPTGMETPKTKKKKAKLGDKGNTGTPAKTLAPLPTVGAPPPPPVQISGPAPTATGSPTPGRKTPVKKRIPPPMDSPVKPVKPLGLGLASQPKPGKMNPEAMNAAIASVGAAPQPAPAPTPVVPASATSVIIPITTFQQMHGTPTGLLYSSATGNQPPPPPVNIPKSVQPPPPIKSSAESIAASIAAVAMGSSSTPATTSASGKPQMPMKRFMKDGPDKGGEKKVFSVTGGQPSPQLVSIPQAQPPQIMIGKAELPSQSTTQVPPSPITIQAKFQPTHTISGGPGMIGTPSPVTFVKGAAGTPGPGQGPHHLVEQQHPHQSNIPKHPVIIIPAAPVVIKPAPYQHQASHIQPIVPKPVQPDGSQQAIQPQQSSLLVTTTSPSVVKSPMLPITVTPSTIQMTSGAPGVLQPLPNVAPGMPRGSLPAVELKPVIPSPHVDQPQNITVTKATTVMKSISPDILAGSSYSNVRGLSTTSYAQVKPEERPVAAKEPEIVVKPAPASAQIVFHTESKKGIESHRPVMQKTEVKEEDNSLLCEEIIPGSPAAGDGDDKGDDDGKDTKEDLTVPSKHKHEGLPPGAATPSSSGGTTPSVTGSGKPVIVLGPKYREDVLDDDPAGFMLDDRRMSKYGLDDYDDNKMEERSVDSPMGPPSEGREADLQFRDSFSDGEGDGGDQYPPSSPSRSSTISTDDSERRHRHLSPTPEGGSSKSKDSDDDIDSDEGSKSTHLDDADSKHGSTRGSTRIRNQTSRLGRSPSPPANKRRRGIRRNKSPEETRYANVARTIRTSSGRKVTPAGRHGSDFIEERKEIRQPPPPPPVNLAKPPKTGRYNFIPDLNGVIDPDTRIALITQAMNDLKEQYQKTKNEAASFDRRCKRWKRRAREKERLARQEATKQAS